MKTKLEKSCGTIHKLNKKWSWRVYVFEPRGQLAICTVSPGFINEFESEKKCIDNMNAVCQKLGIK